MDTTIEQRLDTGGEVTFPDPRPVTVDEDGYVLTEGGEVVGHISAGSLYELPPARLEGGALEIRQGFVPRPVPPDLEPAAADEILRSLAELDCAEAGLAALAKAVLARIDTRANRIRRKAAWLRRVYTPVLEAFGRSHLTGKRRSVAMTWGTLSFRKIPGRVRIADQESAVAWADAHFPEAVRITKSVDAARVRARVEADVELGLIDELPAWLEVVPESESFSITTNISTPPAPVLTDGPPALP